MQKNQPKVIKAWAWYDWANSVYSLSITTAIFPIYYNSITSSNGSDQVVLLGRTFTNTALYSYALSFSFLMVAFLSPLLSGIADYKGNKKFFMKFFCALGSLSCASLYFFKDSGDLLIGISAFIMASVGWAGSIVFYNAFLPEIASEDMQDKVSAKGFSLGYIGSSLLLIFNLMMIMQPHWFGIENAGSASRISFLMTGCWWFLFALYTFHYLPEKTSTKNTDDHLLLKGFHELKKVLTELNHLQSLKRFLFAFFFYNMGVQTVMYVASLFGAKELKLKDDELIITVLIIQFVAIGGAYLFAYLSSKAGNIKALIAAVMVWIGICWAAYYVTSSNEFYALAFTVGMVMGGIQSLSRSTYSKMLPETKDHASYFSFYDVCDKVGLVLGTVAYGYIEEITGSMRNSILILMTFFGVGLFLLLSIRNFKPIERKIINTH
jgi:UMF1 family MFS transporter